jgi:hypothetical protein
MKLLSGLCATAVLLLTVSSSQADEIAYPENYRDWQHVKSMILHKDHALADPFEGIHHIYANDEALQGLQSGNYVDGAVFVFDLLKTVDKDQATTEGERKLVGVMQKDATAYTQTGGWGFEGFAGNSQTERLVKDEGASCFACHASQKDKAYVFTEYRD